MRMVCRNRGGWGGPAPCAELPAEGGGFVFSFIVRLKQYGTNDVADTVSVHGVGRKRRYMFCYF